MGGEFLAYYVKFNVRILFQVVNESNIIADS